MRLFKKGQRQRLGVVRPNVQRILVEMEAVRPIDEQIPEVLAVEIMMQLRDECLEVGSDVWCEAEKAGFDWDGLLEFMIKIIEVLIPLIVKKRAPVQIYT